MKFIEGEFYQIKFNGWDRVSIMRYLGSERDYPAKYREEDDDVLVFVFGEDTKLGKRYWRKNVYPEFIEKAKRIPADQIEEVQTVRGGWRKTRFGRKQNVEG